MPDRCHSAAPRSGEPRIHIPEACVLGFRARTFGLSRNDAGLIKSLILLLLFVAALCGAAAASAQQPMPTEAAHSGGLTPAEAQRAIDTLQDPQKRTQLIETLRAIAKAQPPPIPEKAEERPEPTVALAPDSLGAQLLAQLASGAERLIADAGAAAQTLTDFPLLWRWAKRAATDPGQRAAAIDGAWQLALVLIGALLLERFAAAVMRRPIAALTAH